MTTKRSPRDIGKADIDPSTIDYSDISWVVESIDVESVLDRLDIRVVNRKGDQLWAYCPLHEEYTGRASSHPKWTVNVSTGKTYCFTESRGSNLVYLVSKMRRISRLDAVEWILGVSIDSVEARYSRIKRLIHGHEPIKEIGIFNMEDFEKHLEDGEIFSGSISFLANNNILGKTARKFGCVEFVEGFYRNRLIFPVRNIDKKLVGFIATDVLGSKGWLKENPMIVDPETKEFRKTTKGDYKKVRYPKGFGISKQLIGEDGFKKGDTAILVEGMRDVMKLRQEKFSGALGLGGTNFSDEQLISLTKLHPKKIIIMLDGDRAGRTSEEKIAKKCLNVLGEVYITRVTWSKDPKDFSREEILFFMRNNTKILYLNRGEITWGMSD